METNLFNTAPGELARRTLLDRAERERLDRDRGRPERVRYPAMPCRILEIAGTDKLRVEVAFPAWDAAGRPSRGPWRTDSGHVAAIDDAFPAMRRDADGFWICDASKPVALVIGWRDLSRVDLVEPDWPCELQPPGDRILTDHGPNRPTNVPPGPVALRFAGVLLNARILPHRPPRPATPTLDLSDAERRAIVTAAEAGKGGWEWVSAGQRARKDLEERTAREQWLIDDWQREMTRPRVAYALDANLLAARWPTGLVLSDDC